MDRLRSQSLRTGMQVHAVPDSERAFDQHGKKLPWGFVFADQPTTADAGNTPGRVLSSQTPFGNLPEKGPFGRSTSVRNRRGTSRSRSKTAEPMKKEDVARDETLKFEELLFGRAKEEQRIKDAGAVKGNADLAATAAGSGVDAEPTECILYGYGAEQAWAAIAFYEGVSNGCVYEDYEREDPTGRYRLYTRPQLAKSLGKAALRKKNAYAGGEHWIKITFDSPLAANLACSRSPHMMKGHLVFCEPYRGTGPGRDAPILASNAGAQITSQTLPTSFATTAGSEQRGITTSPTSSDTVTSATATEPQAPLRQPSFIRGSVPHAHSLDLANEPNLPPNDLRATSTTSQALRQRAAPEPHKETLQHRPLRLQGATRAVLQPADLAFAPVPPKWQLSKMLFVGDVISGGIPRLEDGSPDWRTASFWWRFWAWADALLGTDMCGLRIEEESEMAVLVGKDR